MLLVSVAAITIRIALHVLLDSFFTEHPACLHVLKDSTLIIPNVISVLMVAQIVIMAQILAIFAIQPCI